MFTGLIEEMGKIIVLKNNTIKISCNKILENIKIGESVSVNGVCLTISEFTTNSFSADVMPVTLEKSNLGKMQRMKHVNLERALRLDNRLGGHLVSGHIDGTVSIKKMYRSGSANMIRFELPEEKRKFLIPEGSITLNGVSLTVAAIGKNFFEVSLIPETWQHTNLKFAEVGDQINTEFDLIGKYLYNFWKKKDVEKDLTVEFLAEQGYI